MLQNNKNYSTIKNTIYRAHMSRSKIIKYKICYEVNALACSPLRNVVSILKLDFACKHELKHDSFQIETQSEVM